MPVSPEVEREMFEVAKAASKRARIEYSDFPVGAAILSTCGKIIAGCNVENASYGLTNCAERVGIGSAIAQIDDFELEAVLVYTPTDEATAPCGACRQVIREFNYDAVVISVCDTDHRVQTTLRELLPNAFGPESL